MDVMTFRDDDGYEYDREIVGEFERNGRRFIILADVRNDCCNGNEACGCEEEDESTMIFEIVSGENGEALVAVPDDSLPDGPSVVKKWQKKTIQSNEIKEKLI